MKTRRSLVISLFFTLVLSGCKLELGTFEAKLPPPIASTEVDITSLNEISNSEIDAVLATAPDVTEYAAWPTSQIQTFLMTFNVSDTIPNIVINTRIFVFEDHKSEEARMHIVIFGDNPTLAETVGDAHLALNWTSIPNNEGEGAVAAQAPSQKVKFYATPEPARIGEEKMPALTMFVYLVEKGEEGSEENSSQVEENPFSDLSDGTQDDVDALRALGDNIAKVEHWPHPLIENQFQNHERSDFIANYPIHHDIYYQIYMNDHGHDTFSLALLGDNTHLVQAMAGPYKNSSDWVIVQDEYTRVKFTTIDAKVAVDFHFHHLDDPDGMPRGIYIDFIFMTGINI